VTQLTQEQQRVMMEDFHDSAQRAGEALEVVVSVEVEVWAALLSVQLHKHRPERGPAHRAPRLHRQPPERGPTRRA
jgi:hypothetical protein